MKYVAIVGKKIFIFRTSKAAEVFAEKNKLTLREAFENKEGNQVSIFYPRKNVRR